LLTFFLNGGSLPVNAIRKWDYRRSSSWGISWEIRQFNLKPVNDSRKMLLIYLSKRMEVEKFRVVNGRYPKQSEMDLPGHRCEPEGIDVPFFIPGYPRGKKEKVPTRVIPANTPFFVPFVFAGDGIVPSNRLDASHPVQFWSDDFDFRLPMQWNEPEEEAADETPADQTPADQTPADQTPADQTPADQTPADQSEDGASAKATAGDGERSSSDE
jgi:hypothetical protein